MPINRIHEKRIGPLRETVEKGRKRADEYCNIFGRDALLLQAREVARLHEGLGSPHAIGFCQRACEILGLPFDEAEWNL